MKRWIFNAAAGLSLLLCLGTVWLWVDSHHSWRWVGHQGRKRMTGIGSSEGRVQLIIRGSDPLSRRWIYERRRAPSGHTVFYYADRGVLRVERFGFSHMSGPSTHRFRVPHWFPVLLFAILPLVWVRRWRKRIPPGHCQKCGYDLRASPTRCPECGTLIPAAFGRIVPREGKTSAPPE